MVCYSLENKRDVDGGEREAGGGVGGMSDQIQLTSLHHQIPASSAHETRPQLPGPGPSLGWPGTWRR